MLYEVITNGIGKKGEGDNKSPTGIFSIGSAFGFGEQQNLEYPYFKINNNSFWVDDRITSYNVCYTKLLRKANFICICSFGFQ